MKRVERVLINQEEGFKKALILTTRFFRTNYRFTHKFKMKKFKKFLDEQMKPYERKI